MSKYNYTMKTHVAIYNTEEHALDAISLLSDKKFPIEKVSLVEKADVIVDHIKVKSIENYKVIPFVGSLIIGLIIGLLAALKVISIPGLIFLEELTPLVGAFVGFDLGLIVGTLLLIIINIIVKKTKTIEQHKHVESAKYIVVVEGNASDIDNAEKILRTEGTHNHRVMCNYCSAKKVS